MKRRNGVGMLLCMLFGLVAAGCGGSSSGSGDSSSGGSGGSGGGAPTTESLKSLSSIPDLNLDALDAALQSTSASVSKRLAKAAENSSTEFSRAGCELRSCVDEMKHSVLSFRAEKCAMEALETNTDAAVGVNQYNYYAVTLPAGLDDLENEETFYLKVGVNAEGDNALRLFLCEPHPITNETQHTLRDW